jgi:predicted RNA-binding Zn-ribbon protein involved in translation (DUF1610 family)
VTRVTKTATARQCAICERTLLMGERIVRFAPQPGSELVDVCPLCQETALEYGWVKEGAPSTPLVPTERRRRALDLRTILGGRSRDPEEPVAAEPILRRLSGSELALVDAADLFNASQHRRTIGGVAKSLGEPQASIVQLSGVNGELVVTVAWDISWYQYRVTPESAQPVRLAERGHEVYEIDDRYRGWNARVEHDGRLVPDIARV